MSTFQPLPETAGPPVCPRHPDRISYVRCQRCGRPVCPECQRQAPVGVQCVDCVAAAARTVRPTRTAFGGRVREGRPVVTLTIIALCVASYLLQMAVPGWTNRWAFAPAAGEVQPYRFFTTAFLHASIFHILFNMYALWIVGPFLENALGRARYIALYLISAVAGSVGVLLFASPVTDAWVIYAVGASGAVFGLFGAVLVVLRRLGRNARSFLAIIALNLVIGFVVPGIAWQAHVGGLVVGASLGAVYAYAPPARRREVSIVASVLGAVLVVGLALLKYASV
ncbi:MAG: rhomboid family intramembrane serine protease [Cellulomonas sp.]